MYSITEVLRATQSEEKKAGLQQWRERVGEEEANWKQELAIARGNAIDENVQEYFENGACQNEFVEMTLKKFKILSLENKIVSEQLGIYGRYDSILSSLKNGKNFLTEFKNAGKKKKLEWVDPDYWDQLGGYYAILKERGIVIDYALIIMFYPEIKPDLFICSLKRLETYKDSFMERLSIYKKIKA